MYTVTIEAPQDQTTALTMVREVEISRQNWKGFVVSRRYLLVKEAAESENIKIGFSNFPLTFTCQAEWQANLLRNIFKGSIQ